MLRPEVLNVASPVNHEQEAAVTRLMQLAHSAVSKVVTFCTPEAVFVGGNTPLHDWVGNRRNDLNPNLVDPRG